VDASASGYRERLSYPAFNASLASPTTPAFGGGLVLLRHLGEMVAIRVR